MVVSLYDPIGINAIESYFIVNKAYYHKGQFSWKCEILFSNWADTVK